MLCRPACSASLPMLGPVAQPKLSSVTEKFVCPGYLSEAVDVYEAEGRWEQAHTLAASQGSEHGLACSIRWGKLSVGCSAFAS